MTILEILHSTQSNRTKVKALKLALAQENSLDLSGKNLTDQDIINLSNALKNNLSLKTLSLKDNNFCFDNTISFASALKKIKNSLI